MQALDKARITFHNLEELYNVSAKLKSQNYQSEEIEIINSYPASDERAKSKR